MRRTRLCVTSAAAALVLSAAPPAVGHGPCRCLDPVLVEPGRQVRLTSEAGSQAAGAGYPAYRVVFNPRPHDFGIAPRYLASAYRADAPTTTVLSRPRRDPTLKGRFRVPKGTPAGLYMVLIWDGDEAGAHNTWGYLHVVDLSAADGLGVVGRQGGSRRVVETSTPEAAGGPGASTPWALVAGIGLAGLLLGAVGGWAAGRRRP